MILGETGNKHQHDLVEQAMKIQFPDDEICNHDDRTGKYNILEGAVNGDDDQENLRKCTDFLRRINRRRTGRSHFVARLPALQLLPLDDNIWWVSMGHGDGHKRKKKHCIWWCAACGGQ